MIEDERDGGQVEAAAGCSLQCGVGLEDEEDEEDEEEEKYVDTSSPSQKKSMKYALTGAKI